MLKDWKDKILDLEKRIIVLEQDCGGDERVESIAVFVHDEDEIGLSNANVVLSNGSLRYEATTGSAGGCTLRNVKVGNYTLTTEKDGYKDQSIQTEINKTIESIDILLEEGETPPTPPTQLESEIIGLDVNRAVRYIKDCYIDNCIPTYQCLVVDENKIPINKPVTVTFAGETHELTPNSKGICEFDISELSAGEYSITVDFEGDDEYEASTKTNTIKLFDSQDDEGCRVFNKIYEVPEDFEKTVGDTEGLQIVACDPWGNPVTTTFIVNGVKYQIRGEEPLDVRPVTTFPLEDLPAGTYHFIMFNEEDEDYNANSNIEVVTGVLRN